ncbi:hypothetical protein GQ43DRAFT_433408 [Delitschia confertaspora ATCC 74209]|uniref:Uncharacterized protein n=1 Tax=Delitschia confertaspora ATCC 74209 TaxID=1513339 RepID=A0A9P4MWZ1_9PLEO|nr:hypothetical protein GQ43DRAFT_433408 [Delitschia confertaspora ATCC 74209]
MLAGTKERSDGLSLSLQHSNFTSHTIRSQPFIHIDSSSLESPEKFIEIGEIEGALPAVLQIFPLRLLRPQHPRTQPQPPKPPTPHPHSLRITCQAMRGHYDTTGLPPYPPVQPTQAETQQLQQRTALADSLAAQNTQQMNQQEQQTRVTPTLEDLFKQRAAQHAHQQGSVKKQRIEGYGNWRAQYSLIPNSFSGQGVQGQRGQDGCQHQGSQFGNQQRSNMQMGIPEEVKQMASPHAGNALSTQEYGNRTSGGIGKGGFLIYDGPIVRSAHTPQPE